MLEISTTNYLITKKNSYADCRMVSELNELMALMEMDYSKHYMHFRWKIKWWLELLGTLRIMGEMAPSKLLTCAVKCFS